MFIVEKPRIIEGPKDVLVQENSDVFFQCRAIGDPEPTIIWKKADDRMPHERWVNRNMHILILSQPLMYIWVIFSTVYNDKLVAKGLKKKSGK